MCGLRRAFWVICTSILGAAVAVAQNTDATDAAWLYPVVRHARLGAIDAEGREIIPPLYEALDGLTIEDWAQFPRTGDIVWQWSGWSPIDVSEADSLIVFSRRGDWGFLKADGSIAIAANFERVGPFGRDVDLAPAKADGRWGYINRDGEFVIPPRFDNARSFYWENVAAVQTADGWGLIDPVGSWIAMPQFDRDPRPSHEAPFPVEVDGKWGYLSIDGSMVIEPQFDAVTQAMTFREGRANIQIGDKMGFIDESGSVVIAPQYDVAAPFDQGVAMVQQGDGCGYLEKSGEFIVPFGRYDICHNFFGTLARVGRYLQTRGSRDIQWGAIDLDGREVVPIGRFDSIDTVQEGLAAVEKDGTGGYIDGSGQLVIPLGHNGVRGGRAFSSGLAPALGGSGRRWRWGYIDTQGEWVIEAQFDDANPFRYELAFVELEDSVGLVDRNGTLVFEVELDDIAP